MTKRIFSAFLALSLLCFQVPITQASEPVASQEAGTMAPTVSADQTKVPLSSSESAADVAQDNTSIGFLIEDTALSLSTATENIEAAKVQNAAPIALAAADGDGDVVEGPIVGDGPVRQIKGLWWDWPPREIEELPRTYTPDFEWYDDGNWHIDPIPDPDHGVTLPAILTKPIEEGLLLAAASSPVVAAAAAMENAVDSVFSSGQELQQGNLIAAVPGSLDLSAITAPTAAIPSQTMDNTMTVTTTTETICNEANGQCGQNHGQQTVPAAIERMSQAGTEHASPRAKEQLDYLARNAVAPRELQSAPRSSSKKEYSDPFSEIKRYWESSKKVSGRKK